MAPLLGAKNRLNFLDGDVAGVNQHQQEVLGFTLILFFYLKRAFLMFRDRGTDFKEKYGERFTLER